MFLLKYSDEFILLSFSVNLELPISAQAEGVKDFTIEEFLPATTATC